MLMRLVVCGRHVSDHRLCLICAMNRGHVGKEVVAFLLRPIDSSLSRFAEQESCKVECHGHVPCTFWPIEENGMGQSALAPLIL